MLCYRDKSFCEAKHCANFDKCPSAFTDAVKSAAAVWWYGKPLPFDYNEVPVALYVEPEKLKCFVPASDSDKQS